MRNNIRPLVVSVLLALLLQPATWLGWWGILRLAARPPVPPRDETLSLKLVDDPAKDEHEKIRVVDVPRPVIEEEPTDARYYGLYDANPAKESNPPPSARGAAGGGAPEAPPSARPPDLRPPVKAPSAAAPRAETRKDSKVASLSTPEYRSLGVGSLKLSLDDLDAEASTAEPRSPPPSPSPSLLPGPAEAGIDHEYLPEVAEGPGKLIKTKHYKFAGFFLRLKNDVERKWHAREAYMRHDPTGEVYGVKDRYTQLYVKLSKDGRVVDVAVAVSSGLDFLDTEAMSAIKNAQPFHHPPPGLADDDGFIRFYFGFYLYVAEPPRVNVFRY